MTLQTYGVYLVAIAAFFATPPDTSQLLVISNALRVGLRRSVLTIAGDLTANALQMTAAAFGLAVIIVESAATFLAVKWLGVAYLIWIGLRLAFRKVREQDFEPGNRTSRLSLFRQGFFTSCANPYAIIFFAALFPQFIAFDQPIWPQLAVFGGTYLIVDGIVLFLWGDLAVRAVSKLRILSAGWINPACGALMVAAALLLAFKTTGPVQTGL